ncbi:M20 metallopeptidase family protein [Paeniclostridium hominis]|uniref:M20 metallopeptidase family protein n=1 Tax=Paeniclostridium hominis TaxID=2764329 RepID=UPI00165662FC|nr:MULTISPECIES: M20 family metallopeptidase [Paeniclostridium]MBC8632743.1 amidohydrolase [[Eubacterium] tenue]
MLNYEENISEYIIKCRRDLHKIPEVGLNLPKTVDYVKKELDKMNIEYKEFKNCTGLSAIIGKKEGKVIALRADMDALPIKEETDIDFKSTNGNMHGCGHDTHTSMLLGAAKILKANEDKLNGKVKLIFQPGEEEGGGAKVMIEEGVLENPKVDAMIAQHIMPLPILKPGQMVVKKGAMMASSDRFKIKVIGKGGHASTPELTKDPIFMANQIMNMMQGMLTRENDAQNPVVVSISNIKSEQPETPVYNIIPNYVEILGTVRCLESESRDFINKRLEEIVDGVTKTMGGSYEYNYEYGYPALYNNNKMTDFILNTCNKLYGQYSMIALPKGAMGSEDAAYYFEKIPGVYYGLNTAVEGEDVYPLHNPKMKVNESVLEKGCMLLAEGAINFLNSDIKL